MNIRKNTSKLTNIEDFKQVTKVIIDTHGGLQDVIAIVHAIRTASKTNIQIVGITCTNGRRSVQEAATDALLATVLSAQNIPIFKGSTQSMMNNKVYPNCVNFSQSHTFLDQFKAKILKQQHNDNIQSKAAFKFITQQVKTYKNQLGVLCFGSLTNMALASHLSSEVRSLTKVSINGGQFTAMGNVVGKYSEEGNFSYDPQSAHLVVKTFRKSATIPSLFLVPVEKTLSFNFDTSVSRIKTHNQNIKSLIQAWKSEQKQYTLNGSLLNSALFFEPISLKTHFEVYGQICLDGSQVQGLLAVDWLRMDVKEGQRLQNVRIVNQIQQQSIQNSIVQAFQF